MDIELMCPFVYSAHPLTNSGCLISTRSHNAICFAMLICSILFAMLICSILCILFFHTYHSFLNFLLSFQTFLFLLLSGSEMSYPIKPIPDISIAFFHTFDSFIHNSFFHTFYYCIQVMLSYIYLFIQFISFPSAHPLIVRLLSSIILLVSVCALSIGCHRLQG